MKPPGEAASGQASKSGAEKPPLNSQKDAQKERLAKAYAERNALAVGFMHMAIALRWPAGRALDPNAKKSWGPDWQHILCVELPDGNRLQWHLSPDSLPLLSGIPEYRGSLLGANQSWKMNWPQTLARFLANESKASSPMNPASPASLVKSPQNNNKLESPGGVTGESVSGAKTTTASAVQAQPLSGRVKGGQGAKGEVSAKIKASYWGPRTYRIEEFSTFSAALAWLIRNKHTVVKDAQIEEPGVKTRVYNATLLGELALKMGGRGEPLTSSKQPVAAPLQESLSIIERAAKAAKLRRASGVPLKNEQPSGSGDAE